MFNASCFSGLDQQLSISNPPQDTNSVEGGNTIFHCMGEENEVALILYVRSCTVVHGTWLATCACHEGTGVHVRVSRGDRVTHAGVMRGQGYMCMS